MTSPEALMYRALEWVIISRDPDRTPSQLAELDQWLAVDPENQRVFWEIDAAVDAIAASEVISPQSTANYLAGSVRTASNVKPASKLESDVVTLHPNPNESQAPGHTVNAASKT